MLPILFSPKTCRTENLVGCITILSLFNENTSIAQENNVFQSYVLYESDLIHGSTTSFSIVPYYIFTLEIDYKDSVIQQLFVLVKVLHTNELMACQETVIHLTLGHCESLFILPDKKRAGSQQTHGNYCNQFQINQYTILLRQTLLFKCFLKMVSIDYKTVYMLNDRMAK